MPSGQFEPPGLSGAAFVFIPASGTLTSIGGVLNGTGAAIPNVYRFHALGLLPPPTRNVAGLIKGYDFLQNSSNVYTFNTTSPNFKVTPTSGGANDVAALFATLMEIDAATGNPIAEFSLIDLADYIVGYEEVDFITGKYLFPCVSFLFSPFFFE